jgi:TPP-dependent pyruvate/acetoin dehydrogenase alpha subunit
MKGARNKLVDLEKMSEDDLKQLEEEFEAVRERAVRAANAAEKAESAAAAVSGELR